MKNAVYLTVLLYLFCSVSGSLYGIGEKTISLTGDAILKLADYSAGLTGVAQVRPVPVVVLSSARNTAPAAVPDLALSFDEGNPSLFRDSAGHYEVIAGPSLAAADRLRARMGFGAALFAGTSSGSGGRLGRTTASGPLVIEVASNAALLAPHSRVYDFTMEFWLYPLNLENGELVLLWSAASPGSSAAHYTPQQIWCIASKNRLEWSFLNFFTAPDNVQSMDIQIGGVSAVVPKTWTHHLIRFDSDSGMIEYLVNGAAESIVYATPTGHESGEVYTPVAGAGGSFVLGGGFSGLIDEFAVHGACVPGAAARKYPLNNGRIETQAIDLGEGRNSVVKLDVSGGTTSAARTGLNNEYRRNGNFRFADDSEMRFFLRCSDNPYRWDAPWQTVAPGAELDGTANGRYVQLAVDFYPSANGEASPYLEELRVTYQPDEPPLPPAGLTAVAADGGVRLQWKNSPNQNTQGYLVYYGTASDNYFGEDAVLGVSPIDVGKQTEVSINGLKNGTLYYFRVAAYNRKDSGGSAFHAGEFSREARARPLWGISLP